MHEAFNFREIFKCTFKIYNIWPQASKQARTLQTHFHNAVLLVWGSLRLTLMNETLYITIIHEVNCWWMFLWIRWLENCFKQGFQSHPLVTNHIHLNLSVFKVTKACRLHQAGDNYHSSGNLFMTYVNTCWLRLHSNCNTIHEKAWLLDDEFRQNHFIHRFYYT